MINIMMKSTKKRKLINSIKIIFSNRLRCNWCNSNNKKFQWSKSGRWVKAFLCRQKKHWLSNALNLRKEWDQAAECWLLQPWDLAKLKWWNQDHLQLLEEMMNKMVIRDQITHFRQSLWISISSQQLNSEIWLRITWRQKRKKWKLSFKVKPKSQ